MVFLPFVDGVRFLLSSSVSDLENQEVKDFFFLSKKCAKLAGFHKPCVLACFSV